MTNTIKTNKAVTDRFEFRDIRQEEADQAVAIEQICFPPHFPQEPVFPTGGAYPYFLQATRHTLFQR